ncbi:MAG TPA: hypothetical protein VEZ42_14440 [Pseudonocardia sp.]|nr:hypothetical protein [Pseudonocardia sp.]
MTLLAVERIKLLSTRSPWWCSGLAVLLVAGAVGLAASQWPAAEGPFPLGILPLFLQFGLVVVLVMATLAVTTEYRFGTIRTTFQAAPRRPVVLLAKAAVVALVAAVVGLVASLAGWLVATVLQPGAGLALAGEAQWRAVAGAAPVFAVGAVIAVAVGILLRQSAGAVALLLVWTLLAENLVQAIPGVGDEIHAWLPFVVLTRFLTDGLNPVDPPDVLPPLGPWASLGYVALLAGVLLAVAIAVADRRDA